MVLQRYTIEPFLLDRAGVQTTVVAHINTVVLDIEGAKAKAKNIMDAISSDGVRIVLNGAQVWFCLKNAQSRQEHD